MSHRLAIASGACVSVAAWLTWRYVELGTRLTAIRRELANNVRRAADSGAAAGDASGSVAKAVAADESLFDQAVRLATVRQVLGLVVVLLWVVAAVVLWRWYRQRVATARTAERGVGHM